LRLLRGGRSVSRFAVVALGLSLYSYRVRELAFCWLLFLIGFAALALLALGAVLAWYAWTHDSPSTCETTPVSPVLVLPSPGVTLEPVSVVVPAAASELTLEPSATTLLVS